MRDMPQAAVKRQHEVGADDDDDVHARSLIFTCSLQAALHVTAHTYQHIIFEKGSPNPRKRYKPILAELDNASETYTFERPAGTETSNSSSWFNAKHINTEQAALDLQVCIQFNRDCG
jgi:hypothetical protein